MAENYSFYFFLTILQLLIAIFMYHHYNGFEDILEIFEYNPWKDQAIIQRTMNKVVLKKSLHIFLILFMILGIRNNYKYVMKKNNYYKLEDIVQFNQDEKLFTIFKRNFILSFPALITMVIVIYLQINYKIQLVFYLAADIFVYFNLGYVYFGLGIKKTLKRHLDEGKELEDYLTLNYSDNKLPIKGNKDNK